MYIDSHTHLFFEDFRADLDDVVRRAVDAGVGVMVVPGTDLVTSKEAIALAERFECIYACVGFHPHDARKADAESLKAIEQLSWHPKTVAIGEIGLDYHYNFSMPEVQREVFAAQIGIAQRRNLPIVIHSREAESDILRILEGAMRDNPAWRSPPNAARGVFHCFPGDASMAETVIGWGFCISIPGPITFPSKPRKPNTMADVVTSVALQHVLLETDSPFLTPVPHRGKRNEPSNIPLIAKAIATVKHCSIDEVASITTSAAKRLFAIP
jgi:TatD DNase family protein